MFYLKQAFRMLGEIKWGMVWLGGLILMLGLTGQYGFWQQHFDQKLAQAPYFYALVARGEDYSSMLQKLWQLPGIGKIQVLEQNALTEKALALVGHLGEMADDFLATNFTGLKITFTNEAGPRSQQLIRDYMQGLMREEDLTLGPTVQQEGQRLAVWATLDWIMVCTGLITLAAGLIFGRQLRQAAYLMERFQRRQRYAAKMLWSLTALAGLAGAAGFLTWGQPDYLKFGIALLVILVFTAWQGRTSAWRPH